MWPCAGSACDGAAPRLREVRLPKRDRSVKTRFTPDENENGPTNGPFPRIRGTTAYCLRPTAVIASPIVLMAVVVAFISMLNCCEIGWNSTIVLGSSLSMLSTASCSS